MRAVVFTTVYPNDAQPVHGVFVEERARHTARIADLHVIAPVHWQTVWRHRGLRTSVDDRGLRVWHPVFYYVPGLFKLFDWLMLTSSALPSFLRLRRTFDFQLIDSHFGYPEGVAAVVLGRLLGRPVTITLRGSELEMAGFRFRRLAMRLAFPFADAVIAVSNQLAQLARDLGVSEDRIHVVPNGVDTDTFAPRDRAAVRCELGLSAEGRWLVAIGHVKAVKRFHHVISALARLSGEFPDLRLAIVGGVPPSGAAYHRKLLHMVETLGLQDRVSFTGALDRSGVARWLSAADLFVLASEREGSPNAVWEAMACGCPIVATRVGDLDTLIPDAVGVLVDTAGDTHALANGIREALRRPWSPHRIRQQAEARTWHHVAEDVVEIWGRACHLPRAAATIGS